MPCKQRFTHWVQLVIYLHHVFDYGILDHNLHDAALHTSSYNMTHSSQIVNQTKETISRSTYWSSVQLKQALSLQTIYCP